MLLLKLVRPERIFWSSPSAGVSIFALRQVTLRLRDPYEIDGHYDEDEDDGRYCLVY